jgi:hypothetical protein
MLRKLNPPFVGSMRGSRPPAFSSAFITFRCLFCALMCRQLAPSFLVSMLQQRLHHIQMPKMRTHGQASDSIVFVIIASWHPPWNACRNPLRSSSSSNATHPPKCWRTWPQVRCVCLLLLYLYYKAVRVGGGFCNCVGLIDPLFTDVEGVDYSPAF